MDENRATILQESNRIISKLQLLSVFFENEIIYKIYLRSQVIHKLFETNPETDINKLELFHLQFTASVIELLKQIKKNNEKAVSLLFNEIQLNKELMEKINDAVFTEQNFNLDKQRQALKINTSLRKLYQVLSDNSTEYPFSKNINSFSSRFAHDFFYTVSTELLHHLTEFNTAEVYTNAYAVIHKKLLGSLCKYNFKNEFYCGIKTGNGVAEIYKFVDADRYFLFFPARNLFLFVDQAAIAAIEPVNNFIKRATMIHELADKNEQLENSIAVVKAHLPPEINNLLNEDYRKISDINFLQNIGSVDVQANILKTMLNTDSI